MTNYDKIAELVINLTEIDIFENRRTQSHVDARTLFDYIMNRVHKKTLESIAAYYVSKGKSSNHSTIYYRLSKFKELVHNRQNQKPKNSRVYRTSQRITRQTQL